MRRLPLPALVAVGFLAALLVGLGVAAAVGGGGNAPARPTATRAGATPPSLPSRRTRFDPTALEARLPTGTSVVAHARGRSVALFRRAGASRPYRRLGERRLEGHRVPLVFLVSVRRAGWARVELPIRPNLSFAWVRARDVSYASNPYRVRVELRTHRLLVWNGKKQIVRRPVGVGRSLSPTPTGRYYVTELLKPPNPGGFYGPYAFGLSAHSPVYTTFAGGDGQVGIHGTNEPSALGTNVSHGCIRIDNATITRLAHLLPLGTPVVISH